MITDSANDFLQAFAQLPPAAPACARGAFLVSPVDFRLAAQSARDNVYMNMDDAADPQRARDQHAALAEALRADVPVTVFAGDRDAPDGVFPNNVFATTETNLIIGRMHHPIRRKEAQHAGIREYFDRTGRSEIDLSGRDD